MARFVMKLKLSLNTVPPHRFHKHSTKPEEHFATLIHLIKGKEIWLVATIVHEKNSLFWELVMFKCNFS